ncbi:MAG: NPCBM/NEW2 domain-containing protein, partial [Armatimonadota bacterium]
AKTRGLTRGLNTGTYRKLKVVCAGPVVRFYVDGEYEGQLNGIRTDPGRMALFGGDAKHNVYFDDVKIDTNIDPGQYLVVEPQAADDLLLFSPERDVKLTLKVSNFSDSRQDAQLGLSVQSWTGEVIKEAPPSPIALGPGGERTVTFDLGRLPAGFHKLVVKPSDRLLPLAIQERGSGQYSRPDIIVGADWYYRHWDFPPVWWRTYVHAAARQLRDNNFNTVVSFIGMPAETVDILQEYGISCLSRGRNLDHPAVLGSFARDEPKPEDIPKLKEEYLKRQDKAPDKLITTCMIGDGGLKGHVFDAWEELAPIGKVRMFRWYGIKKSWEGINRQRGGRPAFTETLRQAREPEWPYWVVLPSFGGNDPDAYYGNPLPSQIKAMMHLSIANGAQGLIFYTLHGDNAFVKPATLVPTDGKWAAAGDVAGKIARHAKLLKSLEWAGTEPYIDDYAIEGYRLTDDTDQYFYLVNKDPRRTVEFRLFKLSPHGSIRDLYADRPLAIQQETVELLRPGTTIDTGVVHLSLGPGDGTLLRYRPQGEKDAPAPPRVKYPPWVAAVPPAECLYLIDLAPENTPMPGWIPGHDYEKTPWTTLNADQQLFASEGDPGHLYTKSLFAHAETEIVYKLPPGYTHFVAAAGLGNKDRKSCVIFRVLVDGEEKYRSDTYRLGDPVLPVVTDVAGAQELKLITEEAGDGLYGDYAWWGEARLI